MEKKLIFGCSTMARRLFQNLKNDGCSVAAFVVDDAYCRQDQFCGLPLVPYSRMEKLFPPADYEAYVTIGYTDMNARRKEVTERLLALGYSLPNYVHSSVICDQVTMGMGNLFFPGSILDMDVKIGDGNIFVQGSFIAHDVSIGNYNFLSARVALAGDITVGNQNFFGLNCSVRNGVRIGDRCLMGASAYVARDLRDGRVLLPAKSILVRADSRDIINWVMEA